MSEAKGRADKGTDWNGRIPLSVCVVAKERSCDKATEGRTKVLPLPD